MSRPHHRRAAKPINRPIAASGNAPESVSVLRWAADPDVVRQSLRSVSRAWFKLSKTVTTTALYKVCDGLHVRGHIAVMREPYLSRVLEGKKTIESRLSISRIAPYARVSAGDLVFLKESGGPVCGAAVVSGVTTRGPLSQDELEQLLIEHSEGLSLDAEWRSMKRKSRYATLLFLGGVVSLSGREILKSDRTSWMVLHNSPRTLQQDLLHSAACASGKHIIEGSSLLGKDGNALCKHCGQSVIDWALLHTRSFGNIQRIVGELRKDAFRDSWWTCDVDSDALAKAHRRSLRGRVVEATAQRLLQSVGRVYATESGNRAPFRDGRQTPFNGNLIYYAQHAMATCCRKCVSRWHAIPNGRDLDIAEIDYLTRITVHFIKARFPELDSRD